MVARQDNYEENMKCFSMPGDFFRSVPLVLMVNKDVVAVKSK